MFSICILVVSWKATNFAVNAELGFYPLYYIYFENVFKYYFRLINMKSITTYNNTLLVSAFKEGRKVSFEKEVCFMAKKD